jgi:hypothetical protein
MSRHGRRCVAILLPDGGAGEDVFWTVRFDAYRRLLAASGVEAAGIAWGSRVDLRQFDLVLPLLAWGYHSSTSRWYAQLDCWRAQCVRMQNPVAALRWNTSKLYLRQLARRGVRIVPTRFVPVVTSRRVAAAAAAFGTPRVVVKPQISGSAYQTLRVAPGDPLDGGPHSAALIQPYLSCVENEGEVSLFYFAGRYSHAVTKVARAGDFRVQPEFGGAEAPCEPARDMRDLAEGALRAVRHDLLYARIDIVRDSSGEACLIELEAIEPDLYIHAAPDGGQAFAEAIVSCLRRTGTGSGPRARASVLGRRSSAAASGQGLY